MAKRKNIVFMIAALAACGPAGYGARAGMRLKFSAPFAPFMTTSCIPVGCRGKEWARHFFVDI